MDSFFSLSFELTRQKWVENEFFFHFVTLVWNHILSLVNLFYSLLHNTLKFKIIWAVKLVKLKYSCLLYYNLLLVYFRHHHYKLNFVYYMYNNIIKKIPLTAKFLFVLFWNISWYKNLFYHFVFLKISMLKSFSFIIVLLFKKIIFFFMRKKNQNLIFSLFILFTCIL